MFQYAVGRCIAELHGRTLSLDDSKIITTPPGEKPRPYGLRTFPIQEHLLSENPLPPPDRVPFVAQITEVDSAFHPELLDHNPFRFMSLHGYWQSEAYFAPIADIIRREFSFSRSHDKNDPWRAAIVAERMPVGLHVRRQDYLEKGGGHLDFIGIEYYRRAIELMASKVGDPHFFIFSDDLPWCLGNLKIGYPHSFVQHESATEDSAALDMALMSMCRHFIIANSSFSWWAAWLGSGPGKIVIAPARWYRTLLINSSDLVPSRWIRLSS